jgi:hypothetical protein
VSKHQEALNVLITVRRRVLDRLAETVTGNKPDLLRAAEADSGPFTALPDLQKQTDALYRLDSAITALRRLVRRTNSSASSPPTDNEGEHRDRPADTTFSRFIELACGKRLEEASRELARVFRMPLDRMITATRFFARSSQVNPDLVDQLADLPWRLKKASSAQAMSLLVRTFGFQAVETRMAVQALRAAEAAEPTGSAHYNSQVR